MLYGKNNSKLKYLITKFTKKYLTLLNLLTFEKIQSYNKIIIILKTNT